VTAGKQPCVYILAAVSAATCANIQARLLCVLCNRRAAFCTQDGSSAARLGEECILHAAVYLLLQGASRSQQCTCSVPVESCSVTSVCCSLDVYTVQVWGGRTVLRVLATLMGRLCCNCCGSGASILRTAALRSPAFCDAGCGSLCWCATVGQLSCTGCPDLDRVLLACPVLCAVRAMESNRCQSRLLDPRFPADTEAECGLGLPRCLMC
jgi:hypothetical protein